MKDIFAEVNESQKEGVEGKKWVNVFCGPNNHGLFKTTLGVVIKIIMTNLESIKITHTHLTYYLCLAFSVLLHLYAFQISHCYFPTILIIVVSHSHEVELKMLDKDNM